MHSPHRCDAKYAALGSTGPDYSPAIDKLSGFDGLSEYTGPGVVKRSNATNESLTFGLRQGATRRQWP